MVFSKGVLHLYSQAAYWYPAQYPKILDSEQCPYLQSYTALSETDPLLIFFFFSALLPRIQQPTIRERHLEPWKIALIVIGTAVAAAITIGLLVYFLAYDQKLFYYSADVKITNIRYGNEFSRQSSGRFRDLSERVERLIDKTFHNSILRKKYIRSRLIRVSPDADGVMAEALLTFWFSSTDSREALREKVERILRTGLKKYTGPLRINVRYSTISSKYTTSLKASSCPFLIDGT
ncbi:hypothetical protein Q9233_000616 [Columba guinea]|nr:hypothetical protein Q9233_000616 [Columba guinea]